AKTQNQVFANGADDFVSKPFVATELANRILNRLERVRLRAGACQNPGVRYHKH
ncbi:MAG: hypothetical protein F6K09_12030, partial [Merismopedia sp. SIO2A8]|nr:hypothetical protein [Merismopedia sp. SIO2A8]